MIDDLPRHHPAHAALAAYEDLVHWTADEARRVVAESTGRRDEQNAEAEVPSRRVYRRAQANPRAGTRTYAVDGDG
ncbi:hypothetical protein [Streptomyces sp. NRRL B-3648]|uniref:hypothetical protein n=1 Tax=Streptomyces sp. NRRL B-3648 TaxID=1519493 RepID=UPI0006AEE817|nr:hypothetical protein [Streptomyces sp. NRRL B-3648]KOV96174.1 hypothetical protein ADL04_18600 [Streptomyces sp. NRRL B-3648]